MRNIICHRHFSPVTLGLLLVALLLLPSCKDNSKSRIVEPKDSPAILSIPAPDYDYGRLKARAGEKEHDFLIVNEGGEPLVIAGVKPYCHCTRVDYPKHPIKPGHGARLRVFLNPADVGWGAFSRTIAIFPQDLPSQTITVRGTVVSD